MMTETHEADVAQKLQNAVLQAAIDAAEENATSRLTNSEKRIGAGKPGPGRPKGSSNRVTQTIREAVEAASQPGACHPEGLAGWLIERAHGGLGDRQIFAAMVSKAMPMQVNASVDGGIQVQLSWLGTRSIGTTVTQLPEPVTQVLDLERENDGTFRIVNPPAGSDAGQAAAGQEAAGGAKGE